jgi:hypothetical protein
MAASRFRSPFRAKEIMGPKRVITGRANEAGDWFAVGARLRTVVECSVPTGRFTRPRRSKKGIRNLPRKQQTAIRKALRKEATP